MSKKKKKQIRSTVKTAFTAAAICLVCGIVCIIFGKFGYHSDDLVTLDEIQAGQTATVISVDKVNRNLSAKDKKLEEDKGYTGDELKYEYRVVYQVTDSGTDYTYEETLRYHNDGSHTPNIGDTDVINYAVKDGELLVNPETQDVNQFVICGWFLVILGVIAGGVGLFLRK